MQDDAAKEGDANKKDLTLARRSFRALNFNVVIEASDIEIRITLAFQSGKLTIYNGIVREADLKIITDHDVIL